MILFGTGGIRGVMRPGEFDEDLIRTATVGVAEYMHSQHLESVVVAYDTRNNSQKFAQITAETFANNGIDVFLFSEPTPTPMLSFAVRYLKADFGVVITASHNPPEYNGYKVYTKNGVQAVPEITDVLAEYVKNADKNKNTLRKGSITKLDETILEVYLKKIVDILEKEFGKEEIDLTGLSLVYSPLHGTGAKPVTRLLEMLGCSVVRVEEQMTPDGNFPTAHSPNPEEDVALELLRKYMNEKKVSLGMATDPDCDRIGVVFEDTRFTGNEVGVLLTALRLEKTKNLGNNTHYLVKTIVSTDMVKPMCAEKGVDVVETPTGFKFIGDYVEKHPEKEFLIGFEESCGYLIGDHARDKDAVIASALTAICAKNFNLKDKLRELREKYGYYKEELITYKFNSVKEAVDTYNRVKNSTELPNVLKVVDYSNGAEGVIPNDTIRLDFEEGKLFVRPSGTEPKMKAYAMVKGRTEQEALELLKNLKEKASKILG